MVKGVITCICGQLFGFETKSENVECPSCKKLFSPNEHKIIDLEPVAEESIKVGKLIEILQGYDETEVVNYEKVIKDYKISVSKVVEVIDVVGG